MKKFNRVFIFLVAIIAINFVGCSKNENKMISTMAITMVLVGGFLGGYKVLANDEISIDIKNNEVKGYVSLKELTKNLNGNFERNVLNGEVKYISTIHSKIKGTKYKLEFNNSKESFKLDNKELAISYEENSNYIVPTFKNSVIEKNDDLFIHSNYFKRLFLAREDKQGNLSIKKDLAWIIEDRIGEKQIIN
ncbi:MAG: hypothetical protein ACRDD2_08515 [Sarcina sp.]